MEADPARKRNPPFTTTMDDPFPVLAAGTPVAASIGLLQHCPAAVVQEQGAVIGIVTNMDIGKVFDLQ